MLRLYVPHPPAGGRVRITGDERQHLRTLRLGPGDRVVVFDGHGTEHTVVLEDMDAHGATARVERTARPARESALDLVLAPALLKARKLDLVVEKATELGVRRIAPVVCRHEVGHGAAVERWRRIAVAAAKQSGRTAVPVVDAPVALAALLAAPAAGLRLVAYEGADAPPLATLAPAATAVVVVTGPEGGFAPDEIAAATAAGFIAVSLGPRILRAETAAIVAAALCQHRWGDG